MTKSQKQKKKKIHVTHEDTFIEMDEFAFVENCARLNEVKRWGLGRAIKGAFTIKWLGEICQGKGRVTFSAVRNNSSEKEQNVEPKKRKIIGRFK